MATTRYVWLRNSINYEPGAFSARSNGQSTTFVYSLQGGYLNSSFGDVAYVYRAPMSSVSYKKLSETTIAVTISNGTYIGQFTPNTAQTYGRHYLTSIGDIGTGVDKNQVLFASDTRLSFPATVTVYTPNSEYIFRVMCEGGRFGYNSVINTSHIDGILKVEEISGNQGYSRLTLEGLEATADTYGQGGYDDYRFTSATFNVTEQKGSTVQGYNSGATSTAFPNNGERNSSWYTYQGSDNIDPAAVSSPADPRGGLATLVTVTPGTGKVYGGTVSYRYEYSVNGGASWALAGTTPDTSMSITIPEGSPSFQARVRARDDLGFTSATYVYSTQVTVINNEPPTAPGSISVGVPVGGQQVTITITAATDPDGQVVNYFYERSIDGNGWTQIASVNALTYNDTVGTEWATVAYRVRAVDDDGEAGPYVTGETALVNSGWLFISGPAANMGDKPAPFEFSVSAGVSGSSGVTGIAMSITLDGVEIYSGTVSDSDVVTLPMDTRLMGEGTHTIAVAVSKDTYLPTSRAYVFTVPAFDLLDGGRMLQLENKSGQAIFPVTLARAVIGYDGRSLAEITEELLVASMGGAKIAAGTYAGGGTFGQNSPNLLAFAFVPKLLLLLDNLGALTVVVPSIGKYSPRLGTTGAGTVSVSGTSVSWYAASAVDQMNSSGKTYTYVAVG